MFEADKYYKTFKENFYKHIEVITRLDVKEAFDYMVEEAVREKHPDPYFFMVMKDYWLSELELEQGSLYQ